MENIELNKEQTIDVSSPKNFLETLAMVDHYPVFDITDLKRLREQMTEAQILEYYSLLSQLGNPQTGELRVDKNQIIRPKVLYHASRNSDVDMFEPRLEKVRSKDEPPQIFASPSEAVASMFIVPSVDDFVISGSYDSGKTWTCIIGDLEKFMALDQGGYMYTLPEETFDVNPNLGLRLFEWTSVTPVRPKAKKYNPSGLRAMVEHGVRVFEANSELFAHLRGGGDYETIKSGLKEVR